MTCATVDVNLPFSEVVQGQIIFGLVLDQGLVILNISFLYMSLLLIVITKLDNRNNGLYEGPSHGFNCVARSSQHA